MSLFKVPEGASPESTSNETRDMITSPTAMKRIYIFVGVLLQSLLLTQPVGARELHFPSGFRWCVATAAHQIEGGNTESDWWDFEQTPGVIRDGNTSGRACDHWNRLEEDTQLLKDLNVKAYRFSIEWAKLEPRPGEWNLDAVLHYQKELNLLRDQGIEPMITLQHFTLPRWVVERGSWEWEGMPQAFRRYTEFVYSNFGQGVRDWITFNEPMVLLGAGYVDGFFPPLKKDVEAASRAFIGLLMSHAEAYHAIHQMAGTTPVRVGYAHHLRVFEPKNVFNPIDWYVTHKLEEVWNWALAKASETGEIDIYIPFMISVQKRILGLKGTQDFIGVNYYTRDQIHFSFKTFKVERSNPIGAPVSDLDWEIYPKGFYKVLKKVAEYFPRRPILITENGIADRTDELRVPFIQSHLRELHRAIEDGVPVEAYCHWTLMDNFEWREGFSARFGLYEFNPSTLARTPRKSAELFSRIAGTNTLEIP